MFSVAIYITLLQVQVQDWVQMVAMQSQKPCLSAQQENAAFAQSAFVTSTGQPNALSLDVSDSLGSWLPLLEQSSHRLQDLIWEGRINSTRKWADFVRLSIPDRGHPLITVSHLSRVAPMMSHKRQHRDETSSCSHRLSIWKKITHFWKRKLVIPD